MWAKLFLKTPVDVKATDLHMYLDACRRAAKMLADAGVPKEEIPGKLAEAVKVVMEWVG